MELKSSDYKNSIAFLAGLVGAVAPVFISCPGKAQTESVPLNLIFPELNNYSNNNYIDGVLQQRSLTRFTIPSGTQPLPESSTFPSNVQPRPGNLTFPSNTQPRPASPTFPSNTQERTQSPTFSSNTQSLPEPVIFPSNTQPLPGSSTFPNKINIIERIPNDTGIIPEPVPSGTNSAIRSEIIPLPSTSGASSSTGTEF